MSARPTAQLENDSVQSQRELERGLQEVTAYAAWRSLDPGPSASVDARYEALPETTKELMTTHAPRGFVPRTGALDAALAHGEAELIRTSGTTGPAVTLVWSQPWWDASERSSWRLSRPLAAVATGSHREAVLASPRCVGPGERDHPSPVAERTLGRLLFLNEHANVALWDDEAVRRMARELTTYAPAVVEGEPAYLAAFAARAEALALVVPSPGAVVLTYTLATSVERRRIARVFGAPLVSSYGSTETGYVLIECERGRMHHHQSSCRIDLARVRNSPAVGRLLVTPYAHPWACLLKFDVGDLARQASTPCECGIAGNSFERLEGRTTELTVATDGTLVTTAALDFAIAQTPSTHHMISYQLEQDPAGILLSATVSGELDEDAVTARLRALYGPGGELTVRVVAALSPEPSGKYARVRQHLSVDATAWFAE